MKRHVFDSYTYGKDGLLGVKRNGAQGIFLFPNPTTNSAGNKGGQHEYTLQNKKNV